jgi:hypothetical protein
MVDPQSLRRIAVNLLSMALRDSNPHFVRALIAKAIEYLDRANDLEASKILPSQAGRDVSRVE